MRFQEAIDVLSDIKADLLCDTCQAAEVINHEQIGRKLNALEIATRMIDKQISKEPIIPWWQDFDGVGRLCPVCENPISCGKVKDNYCRACGQAIDWSDKL